MGKRSQAVFVAVLMSMGLLTLLVYGHGRREASTVEMACCRQGASGEAVPREAQGQGRWLSSVRHCKTDELPSLPIPSLEWLTAQLPTPDELRPRFASVEEVFRHVPFWHPVVEEDILPTADSAPTDDVLAARRGNAMVLAMVTLSLGVGLASLPVELNSLATRRRTARVTYSRVSREDSDGDKLPLSGKDAEPIDMELGPVRTVVFVVYYIFHNISLLVLTSYSMTYNLMLGALGIDWEMLWLWLVGVLTADVISYTLRAVEAAYHGRVLALPVTEMVMSVLPVLGPRVDLLKDCLFAASAFQLAACAEKQSTQRVGFVIGVLALLTIFLPAPFLFYNGHTRRDLAAEFLPAIVARATEPQESKGPGWCEWICSKVEALTSCSCWRQEDHAARERTWRRWMEIKAAPKLVAQCTDARLRTGLAEDLPQAVLALWAMFVFDKFSGLMLFSFVICAGKIAAVFLLRWFLWRTGIYAVDPVSCFTFLASYHSDLPLKERLEAKNDSGLTPLHQAAWHGETVAALLAAGADKEARDKYGGQTPLHYAARSGHPDVVKLLLDAGADKEAKDEDGLTPLHWAAERGSAETLAALLAAGVDKEAENDFGETPLHPAAAGGHPDVVKVLLDAGADKEAKNEDGKTPLDMVGWGRDATEEEKAACRRLLG